MSRLTQARVSRVIVWPGRRGRGKGKVEEALIFGLFIHWASESVITVVHDGYLIRSHKKGRTVNHDSDRNCKTVKWCTQAVISFKDNSRG